MTVIDWLLDADPSIRWQVMRDLAHEPARARAGRKTTGEVIDPGWLRFSFPTWYFYDVLRGLEYLRGAEVKLEERVAEAIGIPTAGGRSRTSTRARSTSRWRTGEGKPSRWNTLRAMRVLHWFAQGG